MSNDDLFYASEEDKNFYQNSIKGLSSYREGLPYSCQAHNLPFFRYVVEKVNPTFIFEIGFNIGHSASMWLNLTMTKVLSIDISSKEETLHSADVLTGKFKNRFLFLNVNSFLAFEFLKDYKGQYDLAFIDGGHLYDDVMNDIKLCKDLEIKWMAFDDWLPQYGPGVQPAIQKHDLEIIQVMGNNALTKVK
jgi:predicted O-methyltransferase YrrM